MRLPRFFVVALVGLALAACQSQPRRDTPAGGSAIAGTAASLDRFIGDYDSHAQSKAGSARWRISIRKLPVDGWLLWSTSVDGGRPLTLSLPMRIKRLADGSVVLTPYASSDAAAPLDAGFDPGQWNAMDACALRGSVFATPLSLIADRAACATVAQALGERAALLPVAVALTATGLGLRSYADQGMDPGRVIAAARVRWFGGWAAILGAGAQAAAGSNDWHMNRNLRIGSEGGSVAINWRDGQASGHALQLERIAVQDGQVPLLKLSIVDGKGQVIAYAWSDPDSDRIGINLGWIQVGLEAASPSPTSP